MTIDTPGPGSAVSDRGAAQLHAIAGLRESYSLMLGLAGTTCDALRQARARMDEASALRRRPSLTTEARRPQISALEVEAFRTLDPAVIRDPADAAIVARRPTDDDFRDQQRMLDELHATDELIQAGWAILEVLEIRRVGLTDQIEAWDRDFGGGPARV